MFKVFSVDGTEIKTSKPIMYFEIKDEIVFFYDRDLNRNPISAKLLLIISLKRFGYILNIEEEEDV